jgi:hypothetical protein
MRRSAIGLLFLLTVVGCATTSPPVQDNSANEDTEENYITDVYCFPSVNPQATVSHMQPDSLTVPRTEETPADLSILSPASRRIADVIQVRDLVAQIPVVQRDVSLNVADARLRLMELRQELSDRVLLALFDASSVAAELECEKGRADALASGIEEIQNDIQQRRTVIALLADATAGVLSGLFLFGGSEVLSGGVDIFGSILQGSFGWAALGGQQHYELRLTRNHLKELWEGPESSSMFPASVWRFLNGPLHQDRTGSRREMIVQEWKTRLGELESPKDHGRKQLFFGEGGVYSGSQLRHRAEMLDRVKASVRLMNKDLNLLFRESLGHLSGMGQMVNSGAFMFD